MDDVSTANAAARVLEPRSSLDLKELSNGIPRVGDDPLSENQLERPSVEVGVETIREPEPVIPSDEVKLDRILPLLVLSDRLHSSASKHSPNEVIPKPSCLFFKRTLHSTCPRAMHKM